MAVKVIVPEPVAVNNPVNGFKVAEPLPLLLMVKLTAPPPLGNNALVLVMACNVPPTTTVVDTNMDKVGVLFPITINVLVLA